MRKLAFVFLGLSFLENEHTFRWDPTSQRGTLYINEFWQDDFREGSILPDQF
jgi:hypothetical protein